MNIAMRYYGYLFCLKVTEPAVKNKIMMRGLTLWVDTTGKQKKVLGIKYPMGRSGSMRPEDQRIPRQQVPQERREQNARPPIQSRLELIGFSGKGKSEVVNIGEVTGIEVAVKEDPYGGMQYEVKIPLQKIFNDPGVFLSDDRKTISIGLETGYIQIESNTGSGQPVDKTS